MTDDPLRDCPTCGGEVRRVINQVGVVFKGSGFYVTDTKSKNPAAPATQNGAEGEKNGTGEKSAAEPAAEKPAEAKSEAKSPSAEKAAA